MSITVGSVQGSGGEGSHRRFPPCWVDVTLGTGFASFGGEEVEAAVKHRTCLFWLLLISSVVWR